jgi:large subunit ribosomal protein L22
MVSNVTFSLIPVTFSKVFSSVNDCVNIYTLNTKNYNLRHPLLFGAASKNKVIGDAHTDISQTIDKKTAYSNAKYVRGPPSKVRRVLNTIRGRTYEEALMILEYMPYRASEPILKCLMSAASNAKNNLNIMKNTLYVQTAYCDMGPVMKRFRPRAQGKGFKIKKPTSHITITVAEK